MINKKITYALFTSLVIIASIFALSVGVSPSVNNDVSDSSKQKLQFHSTVCTEVERDGISDGEKCTTNILHDTGAEAVENLLGQGLGGGAYLNLTLCNASAGCGTPTAGGGTFNAFVGGNFTSQQGTYISNGNGNWSISYTFTATQDGLKVNVSRLENNTANPFASASFTLETVNDGNTFALTHTIWAI